MRNRIPLREITLRKDELDKCVGCGLCQSVCSTYIITGHESKTARGKIKLLKGLLDGQIKPSSTVADIFDDCLTCYACQTVCPAEIKTEKLWTAARQDLRDFSSTGMRKRLALRWSIAKPGWLRFVTKLLAPVLGFDPVPYQHSIFAKRRIPLIRNAPYIEKLNDEYTPNGNTVGTVGLLVGCSCNYITPWIVDSTIHLLNAAGWRVVVPHDQVCCGAPAINNGEWSTARKLARYNIDVFNQLDADYVTSPDATCASAFAKDYMELFASEPSTLRDAEKLSEKTIELGSLLYRILEPDKLRAKPIKRKIAMHESCHARHIGGENSYRELLNAIDEFQIVKLPKNELCCGFGGSYTVFHRKDSERIAIRKLECIYESGVDEVLVGSPGCLIRLLSALPDGEGSKLRVRHAVELLDEAVK